MKKFDYAVTLYSDDVAFMLCLMRTESLIRMWFHVQVKAHLYFIAFLS